MKSKLFVEDVMHYIENKAAPLHYAFPNDRNGLEFGSAKSQVEKITVCWSPTLDVIRKAILLSSNLIVAHEWLIYEKSGSHWLRKEPGKQDKKVNLERLKLLSKYKISVLKYHSNLDNVPGGTADSLGEYLGFKNLVYKEGLARIYHETPTSLAELAKTVLKKLELPFLKIIGDPNKRISYIGTSVGGLGQIYTYADEFSHAKTDVIIFGETLAYSEIYAYELGCACIITTHESTEMPGLKKLANLLQEKFPNVNVTFLRPDLPTFSIS